MAPYAGATPIGKLQASGFQIPLVTFQPAPLLGCPYKSLGHNVAKGMRVIDADASGSNDTDSLQIFGSPDSAEAALARSVTGVVNQTGHAAQILTSRPDGKNRRSLGASLSFSTAGLDPVAIVLSGGDILPDLFLAFPGVCAPLRTTSIGLKYLHRG